MVITIEEYVLQFGIIFQISFHLHGIGRIAIKKAVTTSSIDKTCHGMIASDISLLKVFILLRCF